jgi:hypothetical protein
MRMTIDICITTITEFCNILHRPVFFLFKNNFSGTGLYLRPQVKAYSVGSNR